MATQYIEDPQSKERIPFEWDKETPPTSDDINKLFQAVSRQRTKGGSVKPTGTVYPPGERLEAPRGDIPVENIPRWAQKYPRLAGGAYAANQIAAPIMEATGLAAGTIAGIPTGPGMIPAAGLGYGMAKEIESNIEPLFDTRKKLAPPEKGMERAKRNVAIGMGIEAGGQALGAGVNMLSGKMTGELAPELEAIRGIFRKFDIKPLPSEVAPSKTKSIIEGTLSYTPMSGDVFYQRGMQRIEQNDRIMQYLINKKAPQNTIEYVGNLIKRDAKTILERYSDKKTGEINSLVERLTSKYGVTGKVGAGETFGNIMEGNRMARRAEIDTLEDSLQSALPQAGKDKITISPETISSIRALRGEELSKSPPLRNQTVLNILNSYLPKAKGKLPKDVAAAIEKNPSILSRDPKLKAMVDEYAAEQPVIKTWEGLRNDRSELLDMSRKIYTKEHRATKESRVWDTLSDRLNKEMETYAESTGGNVWESYNAAREATRKMHELYDKDLLKVMSKKPEDIVDNIVKSGDKGFTLIKQIKEATGEEGIIPLRSAFFKKQLDGATVNGVLQPAKLQANMRKVGDELKNEFLLPEQRGMIDKIINRGIQINTKVGKNTIDFLETISGGSNERIITSLVKPENIYNIRIAKRLLPPERIEQLTSSVLENQVFKISGTGRMQPVSSAKQFDTYKTVLKELIPPERFKDLSDFIKMGRHSVTMEKLATNVSQTGQVFIGHSIINQYMKALGQIATGHIPTGTMTALKETSQLLASKILAKIYLSDIAARYFTRSMRLPPNSAEAISNFAKALGIVAMREGPKEQQENKTNVEANAPAVNAPVKTPPVQTLPEESEGIIRRYAPSPRQSMNNDPLGLR